ncbi:MAG: RelA/SpoT domain-containing protein [Proteobacteria bacterium]|nr:RelA/SpoT domain-containing protein [Pseudomonadota bacterium]MBU2455937.1 RelA/SpoT domain-containing protein [Pseudomonadota bacterium]
MRKRQKEAILISFLKEKQRYEKLADYMIHLIKDDPSTPKESLHTILYRIKDKVRLIEKINEENKQVKGDETLITLKNYQERIGDLLGIRLICLRLSDIDTLKAYLGLLADEKILRFIRKPDHKRSFILPVDPGETIPEDLNLRYSGYSSIHYQVALGQNADAPDGIKELQIELQLRTILEEAWGEIDHKYRYVFSRSGDTLPDHIHTGFYNLSAYLQAAALQAEHLCRQTEAHRLSKLSKTKQPAVVKPVQPAISDAFLTLLEKSFGFKPTVRTLFYILKRLDESGHEQQPQIAFKKIFTKNRLKEFKTIFREILNREAFEKSTKRNLDAINAVNFALSDEAQGRRVAKEGLRSILRWKKERSG